MHSPFKFASRVHSHQLEELVKELRHKDAKIFEPFCDKDFMAEIVHDVITDRLVPLEL